MKTLYYCVVMIIFITGVNCYPEMKQLDDKAAGVSIMYPDEIKTRDFFGNGDIINNNPKYDSVYKLTFGSALVSNCGETLMWYDLEPDSEKILEKLSRRKGQIFFTHLNGTRKFYTVNNQVIGEEMMGNSSEGIYTISLSIIRNGYWINLSVTYYDAFSKIKKTYPSLFTDEFMAGYDGANIDVLKESTLKMIMNGDKTAPPELVKLYQYFTTIKNSIKFY